MSRAQDERQPAIKDVMETVHHADATEYQSMRGCLTLTALIFGCSIIGVVLVLLFGIPAD
ncbi:MAG: hypothetical protein KDA22_00685 [Phycisphaerales bacterium]|nr:hypothetical protein [Phycisphaerales bacterium]